MTERKLRCVELAMTHPNKLNQEGKIYLGKDIIDEMSPSELDDFLRQWGYDRDDRSQESSDNW